MRQKKHLKLLIVFAIILSITISTAQKSNMEIHEKYAGEIVFAEEEINFENIDDGILKDTFKILNTIYGRAFLKKPLAEYYEEYNWNYDFQDEKYEYNITTDIYVDGKKVISWLDELKPEAFNKYTILDLVIAPKLSDKFQYARESSDWAKTISKLSEGEHHIMILIKAQNIENPGLNKDPVTKGEFTITVEPSKLKEFKNKFDIGLPQATILDNEVEEGILMATKNMYAAMTPVKAIIIEPTGQWQFRRDEYGNILSRNFIAAVVLKSFEGKCYVRTARYFQDHKGNFQFDDVRLSEKLQDYLNYRIPCENIR